MSVRLQPLLVHGSDQHGEKGCAVCAVPWHERQGYERAGFCAPEEAKAKAEEILVKHFGGYTVQEAEGGWADGDKLYQEHTIVIYLSDTNLDAVHKASDELIKTFNQSSVLIQANETKTEFYSGT